MPRSRALMWAMVIFGASSMTRLEASNRSFAAAMRDQSCVGEFLAGDVLEQDAGLGGEEPVHHLVAVLLEGEQDARDLAAQAGVPGECPGRPGYLPSDGRAATVTSWPGRRYGTRRRSSAHGNWITPGGSGDSSRSSVLQEQVRRGDGIRARRGNGEGVLDDLAEHVAVLRGVEPGLGGHLAGGDESGQEPPLLRGPQHLRGLGHVRAGGVAHEVAEDEPGLPGAPHALLGGDEPGRGPRRTGSARSRSPPSSSAEVAGLAEAAFLGEVADGGADGAVDALGEAVVAADHLEHPLGGGRGRRSSTRARRVRRTARRRCGPARAPRAASSGMVTAASCGPGRPSGR